ncbi:serine protease 1-like [Scaptodrosophila lebanonensis]|uniref:trypsin n=1 Tax=Drosophila lebanonensis TaxID=7225 RepID=A0A6J2UCZ9_DROLE|nr:serine protease 1-like [Scaptodrosophila lebanonensis]
MKLFIILIFAAVGALPDSLASVMPIKDLPQSQSIDGRITNGYPAYEGKVPYVVGLSFTRSDGTGYWCGGSIIGHTWVLTAAHCTNHGSSVTIYYGASFRFQAQYTHWVGRGDFVQHPNYNSDNLNNDISLIRTPHVDFWNLVNRVELPSYNDRYNSYNGWWAVASGWGYTWNDGGMSDYLNCVDVQIMGNDECRNTFGSNYITDNTLCIRTTDGKSTCSGDSGGPLVLHDGNRLVGITSFGSGGGCTSGAPAGFTRVTGYLDWIRDVTGIVY